MLYGLNRSFTREGWDLCFAVGVTVQDVVPHDKHENWEDFLGSNPPKASTFFERRSSPRLNSFETLSSLYSSRMLIALLWEVPLLRVPNMNDDPVSYNRSLSSNYDKVLANSALPGQLSQGRPSLLL
jgi:hypothetical protein